MSTSRAGNRRYLFQVWLPAIAVCAVVGTALIAALSSGERDRIIPAAGAIAFAVVVAAAIFWYQKNRMARMLQTADPVPFLRSFAASMSRIEHGALYAAAHCATILALYGRFDEAERALQSLLWRGVPPLVQAQCSAAHAVIAYARGSLTEGLDYAVDASEKASVDAAFPGAETSALALRTHRNLGLALSGRATDTTADELRAALARLPLLGQILAAWGLTMVAKRSGDVTKFQEMRAFIERQAPHFTPVLASIGPADPA